MNVKHRQRATRNESRVLSSYMGRRSNYVVDAFNKVGEDGRVLERVVAGFPVSLDAVTSYERIRGERYKCFLWALRIAMIGQPNDVRWRHLLLCAVKSAHR